MKKSLLLLLCVLFAVSCGVNGKLASYHLHYDDLFGSPQDISFVEINPGKYKFVVIDHKALKRTSEVAAEAGAAAAINGTFYNMKKGGSVCYLQIDGIVADTTKGDDMKLRTNGAVVVRKGKLSVVPWSQEKEKRFIRKPGRHTSVMATMPLLIKDGYAVELPYYKGFSDKRHPRSVVFEKDGKICLMVIDGRSKGNAEGMTLDEVQRYLQSMDGGKGCKNAVNLDGGGSSTLWTVKDGVINHPSDNGKFDNKGERRVANSIHALQR
ncbi:MAG: phosphodiester glycosidase family protein [Bacteroidales bacterium]|nr:phosphodiester glycosidase family protein [Bacteroidales bacterium]